MIENILKVSSKTILILSSRSMIKKNTTVACVAVLTNIMKGQSKDWAVTSENGQQANPQKCKYKSTSTRTHLHTIYTMVKHFKFPNEHNHSIENNNYNTNDNTTMFMVLSSWWGHCKSSLGSFDECRPSARWPPTLKPSQLTWPLESAGRPKSSTPIIAIYYCHSAQNLILILPFHKGLVRLSQPRHCSKGVQPMPKAVLYCSGCHDKHKCPQWDFNLGPLTLQSGMMPVDHCDLHLYLSLNRHHPFKLSMHTLSWVHNVIKYNAGTH